MLLFILSILDLILFVYRKKNFKTPINFKTAFSNYLGFTQNTADVSFSRLKNPAFRGTVQQGKKVVKGKDCAVNFVSPVWILGHFFGDCLLRIAGF